MSELNKTSKEEQKIAMSKVDKNRRRFTKAGAATPILMTLASQPVFGGGMQCMSNMMSGNLSDPNRGNCDLGWSPGGWCNPVGKIAGRDTLLAWDLALGTDSYGIFYADVPVDAPIECKTNGQPRKDSMCYVGGTVVSLIDSRPLREVVCDPKTETNEPRHCAAAYLNAKLSEKLGSQFNYVLTVKQVEELCAGGPLPTGYNSLNEFLDSTWELDADGN